MNYADRWPYGTKSFVIIEDIILTFFSNKWYSPIILLLPHFLIGFLTYFNFQIFITKIST